MNKRGVGKEYEQLAASALKKRGLQILEMNFRCAFGEIDIIARDGNVTCFIEVKYRSNDSFGTGEEAVDKRKQHKIRNTADYYKMTHGIGEENDYRFDVVAIGKEKMIWHKNAF